MPARMRVHGVLLASAGHWYSIKAMLAPPTGRYSNTRKSWGAIAALHRRLGPHVYVGPPGSG